MASKFTIKRDTKEKEGFGWHFAEDEVCAGTTEINLKTGDYTVAGMEEIVVVERKRNTAEIAMNIFEDRFLRELERLEAFPHAYLVAEFEWRDVMMFPDNSGIPRSRWPMLKVTSKLLRKRLREIDHSFKTKIFCAGRFAKEFAYDKLKEAYFRHG